MTEADVDMETDGIEDEGPKVGLNEFASRGNSTNLPWIEKYRPTSLQELIAHEEIIQILNKLISSNRLHHLLFYRPTGKGNIGNLRLLIIYFYIRIY